MVTRFVGITPNSVNGTRELGQDNVSTGNHMGLAVERRDPGGSGGTSWYTALEICGAWAKVCSKFTLRLEG